MADTSTEFPDMTRQIRPNKLLDLIFDIDFYQDTIDVRRSVIYDVNEGSEIFIAQTEPPTLKSTVGRIVEVTFLYSTPGQPSSHRLGFQARITKYLEQYQLRAGTSEPALVLSYPVAFKESGLRMHFRLEPTISFEVKFYLAGEKDKDKELAILDISQGGARLNLPGNLQVERNQNLHLNLDINGAVFRVTARIQRLIMGEHSGFHQVGVQFLDLDEAAKERLNRVIQAHARQQLRHRAGLGSTPQST
jgi:hypothetical protein